MLFCKKKLVIIIDIFCLQKKTIKVHFSSKVVEFCVITLLSSASDLCESSVYATVAHRHFTIGTSLPVCLSSSGSRLCSRVTVHLHPSTSASAAAAAAAAAYIEEDRYDSTALHCMCECKRQVGRGEVRRGSRDAAHLLEISIEGSKSQRR